MSWVDFLLQIRRRCRNEGAKMTRRPRRNHRPVFKAKVALAALKGDRTMSELATQFDLNPIQIKQWKDQLLAGVLNDNQKVAKDPEIDLKSLHAKIGQLTLENDFLGSRSTRPVCCRAQSDDQPRSLPKLNTAGRALGDQPWQPLL